MKKRIKGKKYNTETAIAQLHWGNGITAYDNRYEVETLYRKRNGEFFLFIKRGPQIPWSLEHQEVLINTEFIRPITIEQCKKWVKEKIREIDDEVFKILTTKGFKRER